MSARRARPGRAATLLVLLAAPLPACFDTGGTGPDILARGLQSAFSLAVDDQSLYWLDNASHTVWKMPKAGGNPVALSVGLPHFPVEARPALALDAQNVYWISDQDTNGDPQNGGLAREAKSGATPVVLTAGLDEPAALAVSGGVAYVGTADGLFSVPAAGGAVTRLASEPQGVSNVAVDASGVYWLVSGAGTLRTVPLAGGAPTTIVDGPFGNWLRLDATNAYWQAGPQVVTVPKAGGAIAAVLSVQTNVSGFALDSSGYYVGTTYGCACPIEDPECGLPPADGTIQQLAAGAATLDVLWTQSDLFPAEIVLDAKSVYWVDLIGDIERLPK